MEPKKNSAATGMLWISQFRRIAAAKTLSGAMGKDAFLFAYFICFIYFAGNQNAYNPSFSWS